MKYAIPNLATRSKIGQYPRLYIRTEYVDNETILGDYRDYIELKENVPNIRDINECALIIDRLVELFKGNKEKIKNIFYFADEKLEMIFQGERVSFEEAFKDLPLKQIE